MTEPVHPRSTPGPQSTAAAAPGRRPRIWPTVAAAVATFAVLFEFMAFQLSAGNDPALGSSVQVSTPQGRPDPRPVLHRRVVKTRVVHQPADPTAAGTGSAAVGPPTSAPAPVTSSPTPVTSTPAAAPAPVTSSS